MSLPQIAGLELQDLIGKGSCGAVYRAVTADNRTTAAVKVFSSMAINRKLLGIAMRGLQQMPEHPGLLPVTAFDFDSSPYFVATPLVGFTTEDGKGRRTWETPTLESCCGNVGPDEAWRYIYEVCDSMAWLHKHNLVHCNLKPRNVLLEDDPASATKITDVVQGWIGGVHHFEATDHFMYVPPEQAEHPDALATQGTAWDVYAFGVVAYRLLTGRFPRAEEEYERQRKRHTGDRGGMPATFDNPAIMAAVRGQPEIGWPTRTRSKWDERRRQVIERCLALDPRHRWPDLREVMREFERLEADYLLEDARGKIDVERRRQIRRLVLLRSTAIILAAAFLVAAVYGTIYGFAATRRAKKAESANVQKDSQHEVAVADLQSQVGNLAREVAAAKAAKIKSEASLEMSHAAVDQFLTLLLQTPTGLGLQAEISTKQVNEALAFYEQERERIKDDPERLPERARNYFNTAQLLLRKNQRSEAAGWMEEAQTVLATVLKIEPDHKDKVRMETMLGRTCRWLGLLKAEEGHRSDALVLYQQAVTFLTPAVEANPTDRNTRFECASAWYELGKRARRDGEGAVSVHALGKVPTLLNPKLVGEELSAEEQFLLSRSQIERALSLRDEGKLDDAMRSLFDSMEVMVKLVERSKPNNQEQALTLAEAYIEFGEIVAGKLGNSDAKDAQSEAQSILIELVRVHPQWADARFLLARNYGDLAALERDMGNAAEARRKQDMAVKTMEDLSKDNPDNTRFLTELARQQGMSAQLICDLGKPKDAIPVANQAIDRLSGLLKDGGPRLDEMDRKSCGVLLAQLYGILGHSGEVAKDSKLAKAYFTKASEQWSALQTRHGTDETIEAGLTWSKERLGKLK